MLKHRSPSCSALKEIVLYGTSACHLCDHAENILTEILSEDGYVKLDIICSEDLIEQYGERIPVVKRADGKELSWPFDCNQAEAFFFQCDLS